MSGLKVFIRDMIYSVFAKSLGASARSNGFDRLIEELKKAVPDISDQYSSHRVEGPYLERKVRNMHAFQIGLVVGLLEEFVKPSIIDLGDSSGTHIKYIRHILPKEKGMTSLSINIDDEAITRIRSKGLECIKLRVEDMAAHHLKADIVMSFEILEHLSDPVRFLHDLSAIDAKYLVITVPYVQRSRVGLHHIRAGRDNMVNAENTHIFELNPEDWLLIARHSGWERVRDAVYFQYPKTGFWRITKPLWRKFDFEGFYGLILKKDSTWSSKYRDW